nr:MAG TPA: hypothetical protein [Siphoviridae sp. ctEup56]
MGLNKIGPYIFFHSSMRSCNLHKANEGKISWLYKAVSTITG